MAAPIEIGATMQHLVLHCPSREAVLVVDRLDGRLEEKWGADGAAAVARVDGGWRRCGAVLGVMRWAATQEAFLIVAPPSNPVAVLPSIPTLQVAPDAAVAIYRIQSIDVISFITARPMSENEINSTDVGELSKELSSGNFYYSPDADLTRSLQSSLATGAAPVGAMRWARCDDRFFWNRFLVQDFLASPSLALWVAPLFQGCVEIREVPAGPTASLRLLLISRRSKRRPGTRYKDRGVDDDGNVANFVETEQALLLPNGSYSSFVQIRGSVPVFWEQPAGQVDLRNINIKSIGNSMGKTGKITLSRSHEASRGAFAKHFASVYDQYGLSVLINLLSNKKDGEVLLTQAYQTQLSSNRSPHIKYVAWDFHEYCKQGSFVNVSFLLQKLQPDLDMVSHHAYDAVQGHFTLQRGVFRTNCKDCLDRTNIVQMLVAGKSLQNQLHAVDPQLLGGVSIDAMWPSLQRAAESAWVANGDAIARAYAGTGAMKSSIGGGLKALIADGRKSVERYMQATFLDQKKNEALLSLLGVNGKAIALNKDEIDRRQRVLSISHPTVSFSLTIATKNLNGVLPSAFNPQHLLAWLTGTPNPAPAPDLLVIGFQEIIALTPGKVLSPAASAAAFAEWSAHLTALVDGINGPGSYVLIASAHLVGLALFVFAAQSVLPHIREVQRDEVRTGMGGMTGNKGAVGVRCTLHNSSLSFVCAHLAAGQKEVLQRDADVASINTLIFRNATAAAHAKSPHRLLFWLGDFNYRVDMAREEVLQLIAANKLAPLLEHDELGARLKSGQPFDGFQEGPITFHPTYKYDPDSDIYDTSAKGRTPAWCDRVLFRTPEEAPPAARPSLLSYARSELLRLSDHRAVVARFRLPVVMADDNGVPGTDDFDPRKQSMPPPASAPIALTQRRPLPSTPVSSSSTPVASSYSTSSSSTSSSPLSASPSTTPDPSSLPAVPSRLSQPSLPSNRSNSWRLPAVSPTVAALQNEPKPGTRLSGSGTAAPPPSGHRRSTYAIEPQPAGSLLPSPPSSAPILTSPAPPPSTAPPPPPVITSIPPSNNSSVPPSSFVAFFPPNPTPATPPPSVYSHQPQPMYYTNTSAPASPYVASGYSPTINAPPAYAPIDAPPYSSAPPTAPYVPSVPLALMQHSPGFASFSYSNTTPSTGPPLQAYSANPSSLPSPPSSTPQPSASASSNPPFFAPRQPAPVVGAPPIPDRRPPSPRPFASFPADPSVPFKPTTPTTATPPPPIPSHRPPSPLPSANVCASLPSAPTADPSTSFFPPPIPDRRPVYHP